MAERNLLQKGQRKGAAMADRIKEAAGIAVAPPRNWMVSEEAIRARAAELARQNCYETKEEQLRHAEAEYKAAAGWYGQRRADRPCFSNSDSRVPLRTR